MLWRNGFVCALFALATLIGVPGSASAAPVGVLVVTPGASVDAVPVRLTTEKGCPRPATGYVATMKGKGLDEVNVVATSDVGLSFNEGFEVHLGLTFKDVAADNNTTLQGAYVITLRCVDMFTQQSFGEFTATVDFPEPTKYVAQGKSKGPQRATNPVIPPDQDQGLPAPGQPQPDQPGQAAPPAADQQAAPASTAPAASQASSSGGGGRTFLYIAGGVLALIAVAFGVSSIRKRPNAQTPDSASE
ncbi:hypothetical protein [Actinokineospora sp. HUAS TT18]|uniref:hypothetical protein n=1 Tax=Actinokineospora sp. HUAS TT18 TaxID=3447451 RepID=UPI003F527909